MECLTYCVLFSLFTSQSGRLAFANSRGNETIPLTSEIQTQLQIDKNDTALISALNAPSSPDLQLVDTSTDTGSFSSTESAYRNDELISAPTAYTPSSIQTKNTSTKAATGSSKGSAKPTEGGNNFGILTTKTVRRPEPVALTSAELTTIPLDESLFTEKWNENFESTLGEWNRYRPSVTTMRATFANEISTTVESEKRNQHHLTGGSGLTTGSQIEQELSDSHLTNDSQRATPETPVWPVKHASVVEGDVILGGLMMVHSREDNITCGPIMPQGGIQALEAMLFTLDRINAIQLLPNITLGAHILDDCDKDTYGLEMAVDFIKGKIRSRFNFI
ncbi:unnamed protein product [Hermetia illucens]|uniref:Receptor ligand binding region domain-containing protein n=1 Tax=Hermetia illucens TaxID=343691 RepID=A0A7R8YYF1_HERIL|nr:unnamed protein product [Hermetia illucens]